MMLNHVTIQTVVAVFAAVISAAAVVFAWQQVEVSRIHNRRSVVPILQLTPYLEGNPGRNGLYLLNAGLGPAIITDFSVKSGNIVARGFESDRWAEILSASGVNPYCFATAWPKGETALSPEVEVPLIYITKAKGASFCFSELVKLIAGDPIEITVDYESIYGESKQLSENSNIHSKALSALHRKLTGM